MSIKVYQATSAFKAGMMCYYDREFGGLVYIPPEDEVLVAGEDLVIGDIIVKATDE